MQPPRPNGFRDTWCGSLGAANAGERRRVAGWVHRRRDHGGLIFIDLRDRTGLVQLTFHPDRAPEAHAAAHGLRSEDVVTVEGEVVLREEGNVNPNLTTGEIELSVAAIEQLADAQTPPFPIDEDSPVDEAIRLRHRVLDLRREGMRDALLLRHTIVHTIREALDERDFLEIETPILTRSTPEGARDFLVPARSEPGSFYALPQSPQLFKQLLMIAGFERYFQIARCFRDEDLRADRQPEFTQLDLEMAFVGEDDVIEVMEHTMTRVFAAAGLDVPAAPWPRMGYDEAIARYGVDRPDTRFGLELRDVTEHFAATEFKAFASVVEAGGAVLAINAGAREMSRKELDELNDVIRRHGGQAVAPAFVEGGGWRSPIAKFFDESTIAAVTGALEGAEGDLLLFVADRRHVAAKALGALRLALGERFGLIPADRHDLVWIVDFPAFEWNEDAERWDSLHHPFTAPTGDLDGDPGRLRSRAYDLVLDGVEIGGGSIRISRSDVQRRVLELLGIDEEEAGARFGFLLDALQYGAPPHGGIAMGIDRIAAICAGKDSIREVIAFPKTASGSDPLTGAPAPVDEPQLRELGIRTVVQRPQA